MAMPQFEPSATVKAKDHSKGHPAKDRRRGTGRDTRLTGFFIDHHDSQRRIIDPFVTRESP